MGHKDLRQKLVFYNISFSWLLPPDSFQIIFLLRDRENDLMKFLDLDSVRLFEAGRLLNFHHFQQV